MARFLLTFRINSNSSFKLLRKLKQTVVSAKLKMKGFACPHLVMAPPAVPYSFVSG